MTEDFDYYEILEISRNADSHTIKKSYRALALRYHPDRNPGDAAAEEKFKKINEAYEVLIDDEKRGVYDRYGREGLASGGFSDFGNVFGDIFENFFGFSENKARDPKNRKKFAPDLEILLDLEFREAVFGCKKTVENSFKNLCETCDGTGGRDFMACKNCNGRGQIFIRQGFMTFGQTCEKCLGSGEIPAKNCDNCGGAGFTTETESFEISVPEGIDDGQQMKISGRGNRYKKNTRGALFAGVRVKKDENFIRDGQNIFVKVPIFFTGMILGQDISVPSLRGEISLKIPPNSKDGAHFVFKNEGVKAVSGKNRGNFVVVTEMIFPKKLDENQKNLMQNLHESLGEPPHKNIFQGIFERVKSWFA